MKFYITGSNGFIGQAVCSFLKKEGHEIIQHLRAGEDFDRAKWCDGIVHLSAYGNHYHQTNPKEIIQRNISDLVQLISVAKDASALKVFYNISTSSVTIPIQTLYSSSKLFGETLIKSLNDERFINVRPYSVYGIGEALHRFIPTVIRHSKTGEQMELDPFATHDWIYVDDFVRAMFNGHTEVGTGNSYTNLQVVEMLESISGNKLNYTEKKFRSYDNSNWVCPNNNIPHRSLYEGLKQTYDAS